MLSALARARVIAAWLLIGSLLFSHAAVALQACVLDVPAAPSDLVAGVGCCEDSGSSPCHAHCKADKQSVEGAKQPASAARSGSALRVVLPASTCASPVTGAVHSPGPPLSIAFCVLRI